MRVTPSQPGPSPSTRFRSRRRVCGARPAAALTALTALAAALTALAAPPGAPPAVSPAAGDGAFIGVEEIRPGMRGTALTIFEGSALEDFEVEIIGVLRNAIGPQQDMILARLHGDKVEYTGVVAGMSGSPVYIDGRLAGALSYRIGTFTREPIAGITPIADMVRLDGGGATAGGAPASAPDLLGRFLAGGAQGESGAAVAGRAGLTGGATGAGPAVVAGGPAGGLQPIGVPLVCSGCDPGVLRTYAPIFEAHGLQPVAGGGETATKDPAPLVPGSAIGAALVTGDLGMVGIGTLTHVDGRRVFAFGHPLLGVGGVEMPMVQAQVLLTLASSAGSFKIANATAPVGTVVRDGLTAIVGEIGRSAATIPVSVAVISPGGRRQFRYEVLRQRSWAPVLVAATTANSLVRSVQYDAGATLALRSRIVIEGYPDVSWEDLYSGTNPLQPVHVSLANDVAGLFGLLVNNPFEEARVRSAEVEVEMLEEAQVATVASVRAERAEIRPGEPLAVTAVVKPYRGGEREVTWQVALPEDTPAGDVEVIVGSGPAIDGLERRVLERRISQAGSLGDLVRLANRQRNSHTLYLRLSRRAPAAIVKSDILPELPLSVFSVLNNPRLSADVTLMADAPLLEIGQDVDLVVIGGRRISVRVK